MIPSLWILLRMSPLPPSHRPTHIMSASLTREHSGLHASRFMNSHLLGLQWVIPLLLEGLDSMGEARWNSRRGCQFT